MKNKLRSLLIIAAIAAPLAATSAQAAPNGNNRATRPIIKPVPIRPIHPPRSLTGPGALALAAVGLGVALTIARRRS